MLNQHDDPYIDHVPHEQQQQFNRKQRTFKLNECVGSEDRCREFKTGPKFMGDLRPNVAKYMCGFVNSNVDGNVLIGVDDNGSVKGFSMQHRERDNFTLRIDEAMKEITPKIFPESYSVIFHDVVDDNGALIPRLFVIEISIKGKSLPHDQLYSCNRGVFMRRDGGLQNLSPQEIQQWVRQNRNLEVSNIKQELDNVRNMNKLKIQNLERQLRTFREENTKHQERNRELMTQLEVLKSETTYRAKVELEQSAKDEGNKDSNKELRYEISQLRDLIEKQSSQIKSKVCVVM